MKNETPPISGFSVNHLNIKYIEKNAKSQIQSQIQDAKKYYKNSISISPTLTYANRMSSSYNSKSRVNVVDDLASTTPLLPFLPHVPRPPGDTAPLSPKQLYLTTLEHNLSHARALLEHTDRELFWKAVLCIGPPPPPPLSQGDGTHRIALVHFLFGYLHHMGYSMNYQSAQLSPRILEHEEELLEVVYQLLGRIYLCCDDESDDGGSDQHGSMPANRTLSRLQYKCNQEGWGSVQSWRDNLESFGYLSWRMLLGIARTFTYCAGNEMFTRQLFAQVILIQPDLTAKLLDIVDRITATVHGLRKRKEKASVGDEGRGKGKSPAQPSPSPTSPLVQGEEEKNLMNFMYNGFRELDSLLYAGGDAIAQLFMQRPAFIDAIFDCYRVCTLYLQAKPAGGSLNFDIKNKSIGLKRWALSILSAILQFSYFNRMFMAEPAFHFTSPLIDEERIPFPSLSESDKAAFAAAKNEFCDLFLHFLELEDPRSGANVSTGRDQHISFTAFEDAPLLIDLEVQYGIVERIQALMHQVALCPRGALGEPRLSFVVKTLSDLCVYSGNADRRREMLEEMSSRSPSPESDYSDINDEDEISPEDAEAYMKRESLISQIKDLFPHLGSGFIDALLQACSDDVDNATMCILENELPLAVQHLDQRLEKLNIRKQSPVKAEPDYLKTRKNVFDNDELDVFHRTAINQSRVLAPKIVELSKPVLEQDEAAKAAQKELILAAQLAQQMEEDDERDDTYDGDATVLPVIAVDAEGVMCGEVISSAPTVDATGIEDAPGYEADLMAMYSSKPDVFLQTARQSAPRKQLKADTGLSDEQIEGWRIMLERNPRKAQLLEAYRFNDLRNVRSQNQTFESTSTPPPSSLRNFSRGGFTPGRGGGGGGRGGRGSRKNAHSKKMNRGFFGAPNE